MCLVSGISTMQQKKKRKSKGSMQCYACEKTFMTRNALLDHEHMHKGNTTCKVWRRRTNYCGFTLGSFTVFRHNSKKNHKSSQMEKRKERKTRTKRMNIIIGRVNFGTARIVLSFLLKTTQFHQGVKARFVKMGLGLLAHAANLTLAR